MRFSAVLFTSFHSFYLVTILCSCQGEGPGRCSLDEDCDSGQICRDGVCLPGIECVVDSDCPGIQVCVGGKCASIDPCEGVACPEREVCVLGDCVPEPCTPTGCMDPPASICISASVVRDFYAPGTCSDGVCTYSFDDTDCPYGCEDASCLGDPCAGVVCDSPPADFCLADDILRQYQSQGQCQEGSCRYPFDDVNCQYGCQAGACQVCTPQWTDVTGCNCTPSECEGCEGTKQQQDGCGNTREVACTLDPTGCAGQCCSGQCCAAGQVCYNGECCTPNCAGRECGPDGCGDSCGTCEASEICSAGRCTVPYSWADDPTPVDMRDYYATTYQMVQFRRSDESLYSLVKTKSADTILDAGYHGEQQPGVNYSQEYYYTREHRIPQFAGDDPDACFRTARSFRNGDDWHVIELGGGPYTGSDCLTHWAWGAAVSYRRGGTDVPDGLYWGRPDGHVLGEGGYGLFNLDVLYAPSSPNDPSSVIGQAWSTVMLVAKHDTFTPEYGRDEQGVWRAGGGTYERVVQILFIHGTAYSWIPEKTGANSCPNHPYNHYDGYNSYWIHQWLAPGIGVIQEKVFFIEKMGEIECDGAAVDASPIHWRTYIDD